MDIIKKETHRINQQLGASNLTRDVPASCNQLLLVCSSPKVLKDVPILNVKQSGSIKDFLRRSLPSGAQSCRARIPSPHWRYRYSLPTTVSNSMTDPELQVKLLHRSCSTNALFMSNSVPDVLQGIPRQSRSRRKSMPHASSAVVPKLF